MDYKSTLKKVSTNTLPPQSGVGVSKAEGPIIHDAEFTPEEYKTYIDWGHSVYTDALDLAQQAAVKKLGLFHLNPERTDKEMDKIVQDCDNRIAAKGSDLACIGVAGDMEFEL